MKFKNISLRDLKNKEDDIYPALWSKTNTLILIKENGEIYSATNQSMKDNVLKNYSDKEDALLLVWAGKWSNDVFMIDREDIEKINFK